jgi:hypothetical protein
VDVRELFAEVGDALSEIGRLALGVPRGSARPSGIGTGAIGLRSGFRSQLFEQPDPLNQTLAPYLIHGRASFRRGVRVGPTDEAGVPIDPCGQAPARYLVT